MLDRAVIELRGGFSVGCAVLRVPALRLGEWAVHRQIDIDGRFGLTLLPLGLCLPQDWATFSTVKDAVTAMRRISLLRNDWALVSQGDLTAALGARIRRICKLCGAVTAPVGITADADAPLRGCHGHRLNGYKNMVS